jgi:hypothetical protein
MVNCDYCSSSFDDEEAYLNHLSNEHSSDELSSIDKRRIEKEYSESNMNTTLIASVSALSVGLLLLLAFVVADPLDSNNGHNHDNHDHDEIEPTGLRQAHTHGGILVVFPDGPVDFSRQKYQIQDQFFHFEGGNGERWHIHGRKVSLAYAMETVGIDIEDNKTSVTFEGTTYNRSQYDITIQVNGNSVDPESYIIKNRDNITIRISEKDN